MDITFSYREKNNIKDKKKRLIFKLIVVFIDKIDYNNLYRTEKGKQGRILAFKYTDGWALCDGTP